jgi:hypothetical protein
MHTVQVQHVHPGSHADAHEEGGVSALNEYVHGSEKKLFVFTLIGFLLMGAYIVRSVQVSYIFTAIRRAVRICIQSTSALLRAFNYLQQFFSSGILNPQPY